MRLLVKSQTALTKSITEIARDEIRLNEREGHSQEQRWLPEARRS